MNKNIPETVILLHGLFRTSESMQKLAQSLENSGYLVINQTYPSTTALIKSLAENAISKALSSCPKDSKIHFVTHSMGAILLRQYLELHSIKNLGRVVMLGPPNSGSKIVDIFGRIPGFKWLNGPASMELGTAGICKDLGPVKCELGVIAGTWFTDPLGWLVLPKPNDGRVSVESTRVEGMKEHLTLGVTHTFMMQNTQVIKEVLSFINMGYFNTTID